MKWKKKKLCECTEYITDGDHQPAPKADKGVHFIKIKDIVNNQVSFDAQVYVPQEYYDNLPMERKPQKEDVLYTVVGSFGIPSYVQTDELFCFERNIALLHPNKDIEPRFLYYSLKNPAFYKGVEIVANGSAQKLIPLSKLKDLKISVPDKEAQRHIADILSAYDDLIENNQKQIKLLEEADQRLYKEWFVDLRFPGHENTKIVDGVPEGWNEKTLSQVANVIMGQSPKSEFYNSEKKGLPFHQGVGSYGVRFVMDDIYSTSYTRIAEPNSILFSVRAPVGRLNITKNKVVIGRGLAAINQTDGCQSYLYYLLKNKFFKDNIVGNGSIFASVSKDELLNQKFLIPERNLMMQFEKIVSQMDKQIENLDSKNKKLIEARDRLLPKLMSGEVEV